MKLYASEGRSDSYYPGVVPGTNKCLILIDCISISFSHEDPSKYRDLDQRRLEIQNGVKDWYLGTFLVKFNPPVIKEKVETLLMMLDFDSVTAEDPDCDKALEQLGAGIWNVINQGGLRTLGSKITVELSKHEHFYNLVRFTRKYNPGLFSEKSSNVAMQSAISDKPHQAKSVKDDENREIKLQLANNVNVPDPQTSAQSSSVDLAEDKEQPISWIGFSN